MSSFSEVKDSGVRQDFDTGAKRDTQDGKPRFGLIPPYPLKRLAQHYTNGADKYGENNWTKGMPMSRTWESLERHLQAAKEGDTSEDHLAAVAWNAFALMWYAEYMPEMNDLPEYLAQQHADPCTCGENQGCNQSGCGGYPRREEPEDPFLGDLKEEGRYGGIAVLSSRAVPHDRAVILNLAGRANDPYVEYDKDRFLYDR